MCKRHCSRGHSLLTYHTTIAKASPDDCHMSSRYSCVCVCFSWLTADFPSKWMVQNLSGSICQLGNRHSPPVNPEQFSLVKKDCCTENVRTTLARCTCCLIGRVSPHMWLLLLYCCSALAMSCWCLSFFCDFALLSFCFVDCTWLPMLLFKLSSSLHCLQHLQNNLLETVRYSLGNSTNLCCDCNFDFENTADWFAVLHTTWW